MGTFATTMNSMLIRMAVAASGSTPPAHRMTAPSRMPSTCMLDASSPPGGGISARPTPATIATMRNAIFFTENSISNPLPLCYRRSFLMDLKMMFFWISLVPSPVMSTQASS